MITSILLSAALLPTTLPQNPNRQAFEDKYLQVGKQVPEITGTDQDGKPFHLSSYKGKVVVLDFFGFW